jgi:hypothetical protein
VVNWFYFSVKLSLQHPVCVQAVAKKFEALLSLPVSLSASLPAFKRGLKNIDLSSFLKGSMF